MDVYIDAGFDNRLTAVQARLADAYLNAGQAAEARLIAEDLLAREPRVESHVQRLRQALTALGVENPDDVIARQLDSSPLFDDELNLGESDLVSVDAAFPPEPGADLQPFPEVETFAQPEPWSTPAPALVPEPSPRAVAPPVAMDPPIEPRPPAREKRDRSEQGVSPISTRRE